MPVMIRATGSNLVRSRLAAPSVLTPAFSLLPVAARADDMPPLTLDHLALFNATLQHHEYVTFAIMLGVVLFAALCAAMLVRMHSRTSAEADIHRSEIAALRGAIDRATTLLNVEPQILLMWLPNEDTPEATGDATAIAPVERPLDILAFEAWLHAEPPHPPNPPGGTLRARGRA